MIELNSVRYEAYRGVPGLLLPIAHTLGVYPSEEALKRQRLAAGCIALVDDTWDQDSSARRALMDYWERLSRQEVITPPPQLLPQLTQDMAELHSQILPPQARDFFNLGSRALELARRYSTCRSVRSYTKMRLEEGRLAGEMTAAVMPEAERRQPGYYRYVALSARLMGVGNVIDSIFDLKSDFMQGQSRVKPTYLNAMLLGINALPEGVRCCLALGAKGSVDFWKRSIAEGRRLMALKNEANQSDPAARSA